MNKFRLYVDEVGNSDLGNSYNPNHRFLSLTGVIIDLDHVKDVLHPEMEQLKVKHFGAHPDIMEKETDRTVPTRINFRKTLRTF